MKLEKSGVEMNPERMEFMEGEVRLLGDRMLVRPLNPIQSTILETTWKGKPVRGEVLAIGPGEYPNIYNADRSKVRRSKVFRPTEVKVGDIVELGGFDMGGYMFPKVMYRGEQCVIATEKDVCGVHQ